MNLIIAAEIGINHNGDMNICHEMIRQASINGADYVKFQLYEPKILFADEPHLIEEAQRCQFTKDQFKQIVDWCYEENIEWFASVFDEDRLEWTEELEMSMYKLASRSIKKTPEFSKTIASLGKPTFASLGMSAGINIIELFKGYDNVKYLYCISEYPASFESYKNQPIDYTKSLYSGISDHSLGIENSLIAISRGAQFVEKHFTLSKTMDGSDHILSITPDELFALSKYGKEIAKRI